MWPLVVVSGTNLLGCMAYSARMLFSTGLSNCTGLAGEGGRRGESGGGMYWLSVVGCSDNPFKLRSLLGPLEEKDDWSVYCSAVALEGVS